MTVVDRFKEITEEMERDPLFWYNRFEIRFDGEWVDAEPREIAALAAVVPEKVRKKPTDFTLHVDHMPKPVGFSSQVCSNNDGTYSVCSIIRYSSEFSAQVANSKLHHAFDC